MVLTSRIDDLTTLVAGMRWEVAQVGMGRQEARSRAKGGSANLYVLRANDKNLGHVSLPSAGKTPGVRYVAFASAIADSLVGKAWCGLFEIEGRYAVVVADELGIVLPDGDQVFAEKADALRRFDSERQLTNHAFAPEAWTIDATQSSEKLLGGVDWSTAAAMQVLAVSNKKPTVTLLVAAGVIVTAGVGWQYWKQAELKREAALAAQTPAPPPLPWVAKPKPYAAVMACVGARARMASLSRSGWALKDIECDVEQSRFKATLDSYTIFSKLPNLPSGQNIKLKSDGTGIEVDGPLYPARSRNRDNEVGTIEGVLASRNLIVSTTGKVGWQSDGKRSQFNFEIPSNIQQMGTKLGILPTLSFTRIRYGAGQWRIDGEIFS